MMVMKTTWFAGACVMAAWAMFAGSAAAAPPQPRRVLRHIVMYEFKSDQTPERVQEVVDAFRGLPSQIEAILDFECGTNVSREGKSQGFTHVFVVTFADEASLAEYLKHPAHLKYVDVVKDRREKVVVFDYWADR